MEAHFRSDSMERFGVMATVGGLPPGMRETPPEGSVLFAVDHERRLVGADRPGRQFLEGSSERICVRCAGLH
jgi:hypothetical protein